MVASSPVFQAGPQDAFAAGAIFRAAQGQHELHAVFRFRYEHFFKRFPTGYPGVDHEKRLVVEPHDCQATHLCAFDEHETLTAVSTAVPTDLKCLPETWPHWFGFDALGTKHLARTIISTRMVLHPRVRRTDLFTRFHQAILGSYRKGGHLFAVHYSRPDLVSRYESLGHRRYHKAFHLPSGQLRVPMIMDLKDQETPVGKAALPPGFVSPAFCLMQPDERLAYLRSRLDRADRELAGLAHSEHLDPILRLASLLRIDDARILSQSLDEAYFGLILSGSLKETKGSVSRQLGPGEFIGAHLIDGPGVDCTVTSAETGAEILIFAPGLVRVAAAQATQIRDPAGIWDCLLKGVARASAQTENLSPMPPQEGKAACGTPS